MRYAYVLMIALILSLIACSDTDIPDIELPDSVEFGMTEVYLNGERYTVNTEFFHDTINEQLLFVFRQGDSSVLNHLGFSFISVSEGRYIVHTKRELYLGAKTSFRQAVDNEFDGWVYRLKNVDQGYFEIFKLDQENTRVEGSFKVEFELDSKNGFKDTGLPENIKFQGVFHADYMPG